MLSVRRYPEDHKRPNPGEKKTLWAFLGLFGPFSSWSSFGGDRYGPCHSMLVHAGNLPNHAGIRARSRASHRTPVTRPTIRPCGRPTVGWPSLARRPKGQEMTQLFMGAGGPDRLRNSRLFPAKTGGFRPNRDQARRRQGPIGNRLFPAKTGFFRRFPAKTGGNARPDQGPRAWCKPTPTAAAY
jgi:hypothetical protein